MSDEKLNLPVNYDEEMAKEAQAAAEAERPDHPRITCRAGILKYAKEPVPGNKLECIVVADIHSRTFREGAFDEDNPENPVCWAYSDDGKNMKPHPESTKPQCDNCTDCWANQFDTAEKGGGKACKERRKLAIVPAGVQPEDVPTAELASLEIPPTSSRKDWPKYIKTIATIHGLAPTAVYTTIGSVPDEKSQFRLTFEAGARDTPPRLAPELWFALKQRREEAVKMLQEVYDPNPELTEEMLEAKRAREATRKGRASKMR